jgi:hypothetical protein
MGGFFVWSFDQDTLGRAALLSVIEPRSSVRVAGDGTR